MSDFERLGGAPAPEPAGGDGGHGGPGGSTADSRATARAQAEQEAALLADKYDRLLALADLFDSTGEDMRSRSRLGAAILTDDDVTASAELSPKSYRHAEEDIRLATTGKRGLLTRSIELDADALVVRATVLTYRWIDELQDAAYKTLGSIAGRAIGYLAPEVALGGAIVSAGLIETDALDRDGVAAYLSELAENNPELMDHVTSGGGGLLDGLQMRSLLTAGVLAGEAGPAAARGGLRAMGVEPFGVDAGSALRDAAGGLGRSADEAAARGSVAGDAPAGLESLMQTLADLAAQGHSLAVHEVDPTHVIAYLPGQPATAGRRLRLVGGDRAGYKRDLLTALTAAAAEADGEVRVMLVGSGQGGVAVAEVAAAGLPEGLVVDQVVTAGAPSAMVPKIDERIRVLSLEDRADPVALLGSLINADVPNRTTVVFDGGTETGPAAYVSGGRAADEAARTTHPQLRTELNRIRDLGFLS